MKRYLGGLAAPSGFYLDLTTGEIVRPNEMTSLLPGKGKGKYLRVPAPLVVIAAPLVGLAFYIILPAVTIVVFPILLGYKVGLWAWHRVISRAIQPATVGWSLGRAYLVRKARPPAKKGKAEGTEELLKKMEKEIAERREKGEE